MTRLFDELGWSTSTAASIRNTPARPTPGGATAARPGQERRLAHRLPDRHPGIAAKAVSASVYKDQRFSDHAPLIVDYDYIP